MPRAWTGTLVQQPQLLRHIRAHRVQATARVQGGDKGVRIPDKGLNSVQRLLGSGSFGEVFEGRASISAGLPEQRVVLKRVKRSVQVS